MMKEKIIVTLTSYGARLRNLSDVLDSIFNQTVKPDLVVLNLAFGEFVPENVVEYLKEHDVEVNRVPDTKVYKKLIPTLKKYPEACVISIDDDFLYPKDMIADFMMIHQKYPEFPISGNRDILFGLKCHCGCASLTKAEYFRDYLYKIDDDVINNCPSDDILYTYFATKSGHPYIQTGNLYYHNMPSCGNETGGGYSATVVRENGISQSFKYLVERFGEVSFDVKRYSLDEYLFDIACGIEKKVLEEEWEGKCMAIENKVRSSRAYRLGKMLLKPFS